MRFSSLTDRVKGDAADAWDLHYLAKQASMKGEDVIVLSVGDPDFATPDAVVDKALRAIREGDTHYTSISGHDSLRECIAERHHARTGQIVTAQNVITTSGAQNALFACSLCLLDAGDEAIVLQPMYVTYEATVQAPGAKLVPVVLDPDNGFRLDREALEAAISERTRAIFYASPSNPTGISLNRDELAFIAELARRHDLWIVADEVYTDFVFDGEMHHIASQPGMYEHVITLGSMSKSYAMSGWRLGWAIAPAEMVDNMEKLALCMLYGLPGFIQQASEHALRHCDADLQRMREIYRRRRDRLYDALSSMKGLQPLLPDAGMFMMVNVLGTGMSSHEFASELYHATGVSVLDATAFGASAAGYVRVSYTVSDAELDEACRRVGRFVESL
ncbi:MAG: aminotransferase class I/II-fold pyridoxal phosphate-dependent enzyme [Gammaproteobacteria bacterium]|jgi:arginine:pyruvate transaminase|nr:aminotransferase class I/II-fold pyridoxal phosphate-dependent enzyme [Gammaproteobacteria bacterium]